MVANNRIYLDFNATTPVDPKVLEAMLPYFSEHFGNATSDHSYGWYADDAVEKARKQISSVLGCRPNEILFTSGATEAANLGLMGFCKANQHKGNHIVTCKTEHKAVLETMKALENQGFQVTYLDVDAQGSIDLEQFQAALLPTTILVCLMLANNETGVIHPIKSIAEIAQEHDVAVMSDITQAVGKIPVDLKDLNIDLAIFSAHKMYGPKGIGALYLNKKNQVKLEKYFFGGNQEQGFRPGTLNVPAIVGFGEACEIITFKMEEESNRLLQLRNHLEQRLLQVEGAKINGSDVPRLCNTTNVSFSGIEGSKLLLHLKKLAVSRGSACNANLISPSHVLMAMGHDEETALASLRISTGKHTTVADMALAFEAIEKVVNQLKTVSV
ncbi:cysteine desulfurase [Flagellimonas pelagia]|uniref:cysteine desulfurase n=2 Tax=Flagellimonas pelagia TaxID=2306998 RepID=A0A3A1NL20_9FLAO|nr:cysteine desulfurase [Allomuricauda maritima]TXJ92754.1 cysteine desulfurase [Allomuricauda maritima]